MTELLLLALLVTWVVLGLRFSNLNQRLSALERQLQAVLALKAAKPAAPPPLPEVKAEVKGEVTPPAPATSPAPVPDEVDEVDLDPSVGPSRSRPPVFRDTVPMPLPLPTPAPTPAPMAHAWPEPADVTAPVRTAAVREAAGLSFMGLIKRNLFASAGIGLLLLGFTFLLSALSWRELLSPGTRIGLAWVAAAGIAYAGWRFGRRNPLWGQILQGGAAAVAYLATYVGGHAYGLFSDTTALVLFAALSAALVWRAVREDAKVLAGVGFLGAYAAPVLAIQAQQSLLFNLGYGLLVTAFALSLSWRRRWIEIAVHAHLCAAGLASVTYAARWATPAELMSVATQQALLHAYLFQFGVWCVAWSRTHTDDPRETSLLGACLSMVAVVYLAMQHWLWPTGVVFEVAAVGQAVVLAVLALRVFRDALLRETAWVLCALSVAMALARADLTPAVLGLSLFAEGVVMTLAVDSGSRVRQWLARALVVIGFLSMGTHTAWAAALVWLVAMPLSLRYARSLRDVDGWLFAGVALVSGSLCLSQVVDAAALRVAAQLALLSVMVGLALWRRPVAWVPAPALFAFSAAVQWVGVLLHNPGSAGGWQLAALAVPVLATGVGLRRQAGKTLCPPAWQGGATGALELLLTQLPAMAALKLWDAPGLPLLLSTLGLAVHSLARASGTWDRLWQTPAEVDVRPGTTEVAHLGLLAAAGLMALIEHMTPMAQWLAGPVAVGMLVVWARVGEGLTPGVRRVLAALATVVCGYVWVATLQGAGWAMARHSILLPVLVAAVGVVCLFLSARQLQRSAWLVSAGACVLSSLKLLTLVGGALFSPMGAALSLLSMGALFLLAGYLAPLPPAGD